MIVCIVGPTGVGKTKLSITLAKKFNAIIINADAMQVYKELNIGTAKIKEDEKENIPHYLFDICEVTDEYSVYNYQIDARKIIEENKDKNIIFVGGTGLYLKAALYSYHFNEETKEKNNFDNYINQKLYELALKKDKNHNIHVNNRKRLIRFLNKEEINIEPAKPLYNAIFIGLTTDRETLYKKIDDRVDKMMEEGLLEEVKRLYDKKLRCKSINTGIGYKELYQYFDKEISLEEAINLIKKKSRNYAKRQYTFFNNQLPVKYFETDYNDFSKTENEVINYLLNNVKQKM